jgi:copper transporter 1
LVDQQAFDLKVSQSALCGTGIYIVLEMNNNPSDMDHSDMDHSNMDHSSMDHTNMDHSGMDSSMKHGMAMYFYFSSQATILFAGWTTTTAGQMFGSCLIMIIVAALYEGLKVLRDWLLRRALVVHQSNGDVVAVPTNDGDMSCEAPKLTKTHHRTARCRMMSLAHFIQTLLHIIQVAVSYALMLVFMTYNAWLCLSILAGAGIGYFLFCWRRVTVLDSNEHCH